MTFKKTQLALGIATATLSVAGALVSPQAVAHSKAERVAEAASNKADALEAQLQQMQAELASLRAAANAPHGDTEKVQELDQWMQQVKSAPVKAETKDNMVFFRGGYARNDNRRNDLLTGGQFGGNVIDNVLGGGPTNRDGWYIGAGFDFSVNDDLFGLMDNTEVLAELMFEWKSFGTKNFKNHPAIVQGGEDAVGDPSVNPTSQGPLCTLINYASNDELGGGATGAGTRDCNSVSVSQFTLSAAPKIKFMKGSDFRPWIEPIGLALHVFSPPSNGVTVFNPGVMFGAGADYKIWKDIYIGADARYHLTGGSSDGVKLDGLTAGGYLGLGF